MASTVNGIERVTLSATPDTLTRFDLLNRPQYVVVTAETAALKVAMTGTDAGAIGADYTLVAAGVSRAFYVESRAQIYVASSTASAPVSVEDYTK